MRYVKGVYVGETEVTVPGGENHTLHVWRNPETGNVFAVDNMEVKAGDNFVVDPYDENVRIVFADTFTGLPA